MQHIDLSTGYPSIPNITHLNHTSISQLQEAEYVIPAPAQGLDGFREALSAKLQLANYVKGLSMDHVLVTQGVTHALYLITQTYMNPGDRVLLPVPAWSYFFDLYDHAQLEVTKVRTESKNQYKITAEELALNLTEKTKMFVLTNPGNPGGGVYCKEELQAIVEVVKKYPDLIIIADEIYELLIFGEKPFVAFASFDEIADRVISINGFSKSFGLTSWRIGYLYSQNKPLLNPIEKLLNISMYGLPIASQKIAWTSLQKEELYRIIWQQFGKRRREQVQDFLGDKVGVSSYLPDGAYFLYPDFTKFCAKVGFMQSSDFTDFLVRNYNLKLADGANFGTPFHYRINYMQTQGVIQETINRLEMAMRSLLES